MTRQQLGYLRWIILFVLIGDGLFAAAAAVTFSDQNLGALFLNLGTELVGAAITYGLFELVIGLTKESVEKEEELENLKAELITQMGSDEREVAVPAANELRRCGWLTDGSLEGANLRRANLEGANLNHADLQRADLRLANLEGVKLNWEAKITDDQLAQAANLEGAYCWLYREETKDG